MVSAAVRLRASALAVAVLAVAVVSVVRADYILIDGGMQVQSDVYQNGTLQLDHSKPTPYGQDSEFLVIHVYYDTDSRLHVKIHDPNVTAWEVPDSLLNTARDSPPLVVEYVFAVIANPFSFSVTRTHTGEVLFNSDPASLPVTTRDGDAPAQPWLVYSPQYVSITTSLPAATLPLQPAVFGLGEHITRLQLPVDQTYTLWNKDQGNPKDLNLYGSHPFYMRLDTTGTTPSGHAHGVLLWNSNAMDVTLGTRNITYRVTGGVLDFYFFMGLTPEDVMAQYTRLVGRPYMPPLWSIGFHQCRWGYEVVQDTVTVVSRYLAAGIPLDTVWNDIDYMETYYDFTLDPTRFPPDQMRAFHTALSASHQHHVYIVDPGIPDVPHGSTVIPYTSYDAGLAAGIFMRTPGPVNQLNASFDFNPPLLSRVWPHLNVSFPDFSHPNAESYWQNQIAGFFDLGGVASGLWIDMNEPSSFCNGEFPIDCRTVQGPPYSDPPSGVRRAHAPAEEEEEGAEEDESALVPKRVSSYPDPPYVPGGVSLVDSTLDMGAWHSWGQHYNMHNLFGYLEQRATKNALEKLRGMRAFVLTRSTFAGSGSQGAHWTGDNDSTFESMRMSLAHIMSLGLLGIPNAGSDICGFNGNTTFFLCARWFQVGALYPFSRNHNTWNAIPQEAYAFGPVMADIARRAILLRYSLLPYLYSRFIDAHLGGSPVMRPLWFEYPTDTATYPIDEQFMLGRSLLAIPILANETDQVSGYVPDDDYYSLYDGTPYTRSSPTTFHSPLETGMIPLLIRGGHIVPTQLPALTTYDTRTNPYQLTIALDNTGGSTEQATASGNVLIDDGETIGNLDAQPIPQYWRIDFTASFPAPLTLAEVASGKRLPKDTDAGVIEISVKQAVAYPDISHLRVENITIYGVDPTRYSCAGVTINSVALSSSMSCYGDLLRNTMTLTRLDLVLENKNEVSIPLTIPPTPPPSPDTPVPLLHRPLFIWTLVGCLSALVLVVAGIVCYRRHMCARCGCVPGSKWGRDTEAIRLLQQQQAQQAAAQAPAGDL